MATITPALHASGHIVRLTCGFFTADNASTLKVFRRVGASGPVSRLRLTRGTYIGTPEYGSLVYTGDPLVTNLTNVSGTYSGVTILDPEPPQSSGVQYSLEVYSSSGTLVDSAAFTTLAATPSRGGDFLYDLRTLARGMVVNVGDWRELETAVRSEVSIPNAGLGAVAGVDRVGLPSFSLDLVTTTATEAQSLRGLLRFGGPSYALSPQTLGYGFSGPVYFAVTGFSESRVTRLGSESSRLWSLDCQVVLPPAALYRTASNVASLVSAWGTFYTGYVAETFSFIDGSSGVPASYPSGTVT